MSSIKRAVWGLALATTFLALSADAKVKKEGAWPDGEKPVSIKVDATRPEALRKLADAAGWNLVLPAAVKDDAEKVEVQVKDESPQAVLEAILDHGDFVAKRSGKLVTIARADAPKADAAKADADKADADKADAAAAKDDADKAADTAKPDASGAADSGAIRLTRALSARGEDRTVMGGNLRVEKGETVHDVAVFGGTVDVLGTVTGNLVVTGGTARVHDGAVIEGDATAVGGHLALEKGSEVEGDVGVVGGWLERAEGAKVHGRVVDGANKGKVNVHVDDKGHVKSEVREESRSRGFFDKLGSAIRNAALFFVFGVVILALGGQRVENLRVEAARAPMKSFALGVLGTIGFAVTAVLLSITVIGIPLVAVAAIAAVIGVYAAIVSVLTTAGAAVLRHRTQNPYVHLAAGCAAFFLLGLVPYVGTAFIVIVTLIGVGTLVSTRMGAGKKRA